MASAPSHHLRAQERNTAPLARESWGYLAAIGFFRTNQLGQLSELGSVPVAEAGVDPGRHAADRGGRETLVAGELRCAGLGAGLGAGVGRPLA
jgi:hypothetical protein